MGTERGAWLPLTIMLLGGAPASAFAQTSVTDVLSFLVTNQAVETGSVERDVAAARATSDTISRALLANLATLPIPSTSSAFVYRLNPDIGTVERAAQTFGPALIQNALTTGRGNAGAGLTFQHLRFTALDGESLRDGTLVTTANKFVDEAEPFDVDQLTLAIDADIVTLYGSVGLGDRVEIGAAAPFVWLRVDGSRVNSYRGRTFTQAAGNAVAFGVADILARGKVNLFEEAGSSLAAGVDVRFPTGRREDLLGTGRTGVRFSAMGTVEGDRMTAHANAGFAFGGLAEEVSYGFALSGAATPRLTVTVEALGRFVDTAGSIDTVTLPHPTLAGVETLRLSAGSSRLQTLTIAPGLKWNIADTWVLVASVGVPLNKGGLRAPFVPFVGLDYSLGR